MCRIFELDLAFNLQQFRSPLLGSLGRAVESWMMRHFDTVSTISGRMLERVRQKGVMEERSVLFPNWVDTSSIYPLPKSDGNKIVALYSGTTGAKQGLDLLIDAARLMRNQSHIEIVICGDGTANLRQRARDLPNVRFLPLQPLESLNELLSTADIHLLPQKSAAADLVMPSKLLGMVASGRPIIATAGEGTEVAKVVSKCGIVVPPDCPEALAGAIVELASDPERRRELGRRARDIALIACEKDAIIAAFEREVQSRVQPSNPVPQQVIQAAHVHGNSAR